MTDCAKSWTFFGGKSGVMLLYGKQGFFHNKSEMLNSKQKNQKGKHSYQERNLERKLKSVLKLGGCYFD